MNVLVTGGAGYIGSHTCLELPYEIVARRPGDIATCYADPAKSAEVLGWKAEKTLEDMCRDSWNWQKNNPNGYEG